MYIIYIRSTGVHTVHSEGCKLAELRVKVLTRGETVTRVHDGPQNYAPPLMLAHHI